MKTPTRLVALVAVGALAMVTMAATTIHQPVPISASAYLDCGDTVPVPGKVLWHFVLTDTTANEAMLTATFGHPDFDKAVLSDKNSGGVLHFNVTTDLGVDLLNAVTTADGGNLNLSHTCYTEVPTSSPSSEPSTEPSPTPSSEPSASPTPTPTATPSSSVAPTPTTSPSATPTSTGSPVVTPRVTLPPTDTQADPTTDSSVTNGGVLGLVILVGAVAFIVGYSLRPRR